MLTGHQPRENGRQQHGDSDQGFLLSGGKLGANNTISAPARPATAAAVNTGSCFTLSFICIAPLCYGAPGCRAVRVYIQQCTTRSVIALIQAPQRRRMRRRAAALVCGNPAAVARDN